MAVIAVMVYHANPRWLAGGYLGVEVFFVISGYLITLLLMAEHERIGADRPGGVLGTSGTAPAAGDVLHAVPGADLRHDLQVVACLVELRGDLLAAIFYVSNWYQIWVGHGYTAGADSVPLRHLWSLAVEEQFYIVWPVVMVLLMRRGGTRRLALTARWLVIAALVITVVVAVLYYPGRIGECDVTPDAYWNVGGRCISKMDFLYLSTPTRAGGLLLGAAMAMVWRPRAIMRSRMRDRGALLDLVALVGLLVLGGAVLVRADRLDRPAPTPWLFRGGFFVTGVASLMVIAAATHRHTLTSKVFAHTAAAVGGHAVVRAVPLPLADLPDHPQGRRQRADVAAVHRGDDRHLDPHRVLVPDASRCRFGVASSPPGGIRCGGAPARCRAR